MIFQINMAIALSLIALVAGMYLLMKVWKEQMCCKEEMCCKVFAKIVGYVVVIVSILIFLCSSFHGVLYITGVDIGCGMGGKWYKKDMMHNKMMMHSPRIKMMQPQEAEQKSPQQRK
ncbi:MAG: hypothetical protein ABH871_07685 [Pseudomonadota bacterium]